MRPLRDPAGEELKHLTAACELAGKVVLEIGCGDGIFVKQYAWMTQKVIGIDPISSEVKIASKRRRIGRSLFMQGKCEQLPFPDQLFDIAIFASSL